MFELNGDAEVKAFKDIKGRSAIIVDDFYKDAGILIDVRLGWVVGGRKK